MSGLPQRRAMAVLAVLAACGDLGCTRERLLALLWPESDEMRARHSLRDALHAIRHALTPTAIPSVASLLRIDPSVIASDVVEFTRALAGGRLEDAVRAYRGPFLEGFHLDGAPEFEDWLASERARLERECVEALEQLAVLAEGEGAWATAARWWVRAVEHDPLNSRFVLRQAEALTATGDRANALQIWDLHVRRLEAELGLKPDSAALARIEKIRRGEPHAQAISPALPSRAVAPPGAGIGSDPVVPVPPHGDTTSLVVAPVATRPVRWWTWLAGVAALVTAAGALLVLRPSVSGGDRPAPRTAIAVLPFQNLTPDSSQAWFAVGLHDELLTQLARVGELRVIGAASVGGYRQTSKSLAQIGDELAAGSVVQASVQVLGNRMRAAIQLVEPATGRQLWAETYDRPLDDAFAVQSDIARQIVRAVGVALTGPGVSSIAAAPTSSADAYLLYLQGLEYARRPGNQRENLGIAQGFYERALALDSTFALAHAALSMVHGGFVSLRYDESPARREQQLEEARAALRMAPMLPQGHTALAFTYCGSGQCDMRALRELTAAAQRAPNDASLWGTISLVQARLGNWDSVDVTFERAFRLDPRNVDLVQAQGNRLHCRRRYPEAIATYRRALALAPDYLQPHLALGWSYVLWQGRMDTLRAVLQGLPDREPGGGAPRTGVEQAIVLLWQRQPDSVLALLRGLGGDLWMSAETVTPRLMTAGSAHLLKGDRIRAHAAFDSAARLIDSALRLHPGDARLHGSLGAAMAALGRRAEALAEVRWLEQSDGYRNDHNCPTEPEARAVILANIGETDSALAAIERLLAGTSRVTAHTLRLDPLWDALRGNPRFQALLARYREPLPIRSPIAPAPGQPSAARAHP